MPFGQGRQRTKLLPSLFVQTAPIESESFDDSRCQARPETSKASFFEESYSAIKAFNIWYSPNRKEQKSIEFKFLFLGPVAWQTLYLAIIWLISC